MTNPVMESLKRFTRKFILSFLPISLRSITHNDNVIDLQLNSRHNKMCKGEGVGIHLEATASKSAIALNVIKIFIGILQSLHSVRF